MNPKVHQVDAGASGAPVARANEKPATGEFSRAGSQTGEYDAVSLQERESSTNQRTEYLFIDQQA